MSNPYIQNVTVFATRLWLKDRLLNNALSRTNGGVLAAEPHLLVAVLALAELLQELQLLLLIPVLLRGSAPRAVSREMPVTSAV